MELSIENPALADVGVLVGRWDVYADQRGVSRVYTMSLDERRWRLSRSDPGFLQRFEGRITESGRRIEGEWSKSHDDGSTWLHDFDLTYLRA